MDESIPGDSILNFSAQAHERKLEACQEIDRRSRFGVPVKSVECSVHESLSCLT
jgi:hypothetical protein